MTWVQDPIPGLEWAGKPPISAFDLMPPDRVAPCHLNERETSGDPDWPGSPCFIEDGLCLTCSARTKES